MTTRGAGPFPVWYHRHRHRVSAMVPSRICVCRPSAALDSMDGHLLLLEGFHAPDEQEQSQSPPADTERQVKLTPREILLLAAGNRHPPRQTVSAQQISMS